MDAPQHLVHRRVCGYLSGGSPENWQLSQSHARSDLAPYDAHDQIARLPSASGHVDVRVGIVAHNCVRRCDTARGMVAVQVLRHDNRSVGAEVLPDALDHIAVAVVNFIDHHRTVQVQQNAVHRAAFGFGPP